MRGVAWCAEPGIAAAGGVRHSVSRVRLVLVTAVHPDRTASVLLCTAVSHRPDTRISELPSLHTWQRGGSTGRYRTCENRKCCIGRRSGVRNPGVLHRAAVWCAEPGSVATGGVRHSVSRVRLVLVTAVHSDRTVSVLICTAVSHRPDTGYRMPDAACCCTPGFHTLDAACCSTPGFRTPSVTLIGTTLVPLLTGSFG